MNSSPSGQQSSPDGGKKKANARPEEAKNGRESRLLKQGSVRFLADPTSKERPPAWLNILSSSLQGDGSTVIAAVENQQQPLTAGSGPPKKKKKNNITSQPLQHAAAV